MIDKKAKQLILNIENHMEVMKYKTKVNTKDIDNLKSKFKLFMNYLQKKA